MSPSRSADQANPESPSSIPSPLPTPRSPLFKAPAPSPTPSQTSSSPSPEGTPSPSPHPLDADGAGPSWSTDAPSAPDLSAVERSDTLSTGSGAKLSKAGLKTVVGTGFRQACRLLAAFAADEVERAAGVWSPDPEDIEDIARPATSLIYRRLPDEAKGGDAIDLIGLGMALVAYVGKNLQWRAQVRAVRQQQEAAGINVEAVDPGQAVSPAEFFERTRHTAGGGY
jgi:hypothetical protein